MPKENGLTEYFVAGRMVDPAAAKLQPFWKLGAPTESKYALRNGISIASTAALRM